MKLFKLIIISLFIIIGISACGQTDYQKRYSTNTPESILERSNTKGFNSVKIHLPSGETSDLDLYSTVTSEIDGTVKIETQGIDETLKLEPISPITYDYDKKGDRVGMRRYTDIAGKTIYMITDGENIMVGNDTQGYFYFYNEEDQKTQTPTYFN